MPFVFKEELSEGEQEANVYSADAYNNLKNDLTTLRTQFEQTQQKLATMELDKKDLLGQLDDAKRRFADAFLSSPEQVKEENKEDVIEESSPMTFSALFEGKGENAY